MKFVLDDEDDDDDVVVDVGAGVSVDVGSFDDVDSICVFMVMIRWHLLLSCLFHHCKKNWDCDRCCCCCRSCCCIVVVVVVVVVFVFVIVPDCCHSVA